MFTDIVGYTSLMQQDERATLAILKKNLEIHKSAIEEFHGKLIKEIGDGILACFTTVSDALNAAISIQTQCNEIGTFKISVGIHQGEVLFDNSDIFGDAVNIASRIQSISIGGSVLFSKKFRDELRNKSEYQMISLGAFAFKNIDEPIEVFALANPGLIVPDRKKMQGKLKNKARKRYVIPFLVFLLLLIGMVSYRIAFREAAVPYVEKSIAVLPFVNMSNDQEQEYFSDGLAEQLLNQLTKVRDLKVIGRTSSFSFKGQNTDLRTIGEKLGVTHLLEGSVSTSANTIRITAQLVDALDGTSLFSETYDRNMEDIFKIQDEIAARVVKALKISLFSRDVLKSATQDNMQAYNHYLKGRHYLIFGDDGSGKLARESFEAALAIDSLYAKPWAGLAQLKYYGSDSIAYSIDVAKGKDYALKAFELDPDDPEAVAALAWGYIASDYDYISAENELLRSLEENPNNLDLLITIVWLNLALHRPEVAEQYALKIAEKDPINPWSYTALGRSHWAQGKLALAEKDYQENVKLKQSFSGHYLWCLGMIALTRGNAREALDFFLHENTRNTPSSIIASSMAYLDLGQKDKSDAILAKAEKDFGEIFPAGIANAYAYRKDKEGTFKWLEKSIRYKDPDILLFPWTFYDSFKEEPEFRAIKKQLNLSF